MWLRSITGLGLRRGLNNKQLNTMHQEFLWSELSLWERFRYVSFCCLKGVPAFNFVLEEVYHWVSVWSWKTVPLSINFLAYAPSFSRVKSKVFHVPRLTIIIIISMWQDQREQFPHCQAIKPTSTAESFLAGGDLMAYKCHFWICGRGNRKDVNSILWSPRIRSVKINRNGHKGFFDAPFSASETGVSS